MIDLDALGAWMDEVGLPPGEITEVETLGGGTQNILLRFRRGAEIYVLRHPPEHKRSNSDETMRREARVLAARARTDGVNPTLGLPSAYVAAPEWRRELGLAMADAPRDLSSIAWYEVLACYKLGLILEGTHARACASLVPREIGDQLHASTLALFRRALDRIRHA